MSGKLLARRGGCIMRMKGFRRKEGIGTLGMDDSVTDAVKKGSFASGKDTLTLRVLESFGMNSKRARCLGISMVIEYQ
jgi:hypothetical protein